MKTACKLLVLLLVCLPGLKSHASGNEGKIFYNISLHGGSGLPHHHSQVYFNTDYIRAIEFNAWFNNSAATRSGNFVPGAGYFFTNLGNRNIYGNSHVLYLGMLNPLHHQLPVQLKIGFGIAYATKKFDIENNYFNRAIGSHFNAYGQISLTGRIPVVEDKLIFRPGLSIHHLSSGAVIKPNQGLNLVTFNAGIDFNSGRSHRGISAFERDTTRIWKNRFSIIVAPGLKHVDWRVDKQIVTTSLIFDYGYIYRPERSIGFGISFFHNDSWAYVPYIRTSKDESLSPYQSAIHLSFQRDLGRLAFILHPGMYIYMPAKDRTYLTNRVGVKYRAANNLAFQVSIKSHWFAIADYFEWGIGYEFNR
jgi:hypothetical protein